VFGKKNNIKLLDGFIYSTESIGLDFCGIQILNFIEAGIMLQFS
jgi:hypothetical protein